MRTPFEGAVEEAGQGVRALVDGVEARLGSADFCGVPHARRRAGRAAPAPRTSCFVHGGPRALVIAISQKLRPDAVESRQGAARGAGSICAFSPATAPRRLRRSRARSASRIWQGGLKPADKIAVIDALKANGRRVLMVGDGLNDAPSLAAAHVSLSPITAADVTQAQADAVFLGERLTPVLDAVVIAAPARAR